jgi:sorbitol/mannitol transport system permease protein
MARKVTNQQAAVSTIGAWAVGFIIFFPILWMILTSFKTELDAFSTPPKFLFFHWTRRITASSRNAATIFCTR